MKIWPTWSVEHNCLTFTQSGPMKAAGWLDLGEVDVSFTIPSDFNPTAAAVEALTVKREEVVAEFTTKLADIDNKLADLLAIPMEVPNAHGQ